MSWLANLYKTYDAAQAISENNSESENPLIPIHHVAQTAHIEITVDQDGNFFSAKVLEEKFVVILPATEKSAGRTSKIPHPLADKIEYVAKDYPEYAEKKISYFKDYHMQLKTWCDSLFAHEQVKAILKYIEKGTVVKDLVAEKILPVGSENKFLTEWNGEDKPQILKILKGTETDFGNALICWRYKKTNEVPLKTWENKEIQQSWINFVSQGEGSLGFCFILNKETVLAENHPIKIRHTRDRAKLISSNDEDGFTFRGRFKTPFEACGISADVTQKAHNVLSWLIKRQGSVYDDQAVVAWASSAQEVPPPYKIDESESLDEIPELSLLVSEESPSSDLRQNLALKIKEKRLGLGKNKIENYEKISLIVLDSASTGRMSIAYYQEFEPKRYLDNLNAWYSDFQWWQKIKSTDKKHNFIYPVPLPPSPFAIVHAAYGKDVNENLRKKTVRELLYCIAENKQISLRLVESVVRRVSNPNSYSKDDRWRWKNDLAVACALHKGYSLREKRREYSMSLEEDYRSRDYLYGRLLAIAERFESKALEISGENRMTNAERLMLRFSQRPYSTWKIIEESLNPYRRRFQSEEYIKRLFYFDSQLGKIHNLFDREDFKNDDPLEGEYLLGYYCQKYKQKNDESENLENKNEKGEQK